MRRTRGFLVGFLVLLFLGLSFNAYACLVPLFGAAEATMGSGCSDAQEQPARQFCDAFKTLGVDASPQLNPAIDCQMLCPEDTATLSLLLGPSIRLLVFDHPGDRPPQNLLVKTTVLRL